MGFEALDCVGSLGVWACLDGKNMVVQLFRVVTALPAAYTKLRPPKQGPLMIKDLRIFRAREQERSFRAVHRPVSILSLCVWTGC